MLHYFEQLGAVCHLIPNDTPIKDIQWNNYSAVVLSPGPGRPEKAGYLMEYVKLLYDKFPVLGICLGHQALCYFNNAQIERAIRPMHGKISTIFCDNDAVFKELPSKINVVRYHSLICKDVPENFNVIARTSEGEIMAVKDKSLPVWGLQYHPEAALTEGGLQMIKNWLVFNQLI